MILTAVGTSAGAVHCQDRKDLAGACFTVHGRLWLYCGDAQFRLWHIGTRHEFDVGLQEDFPKNLERFFRSCTDPGGPNWIFGDYLVCPLEKEVSGAAQAACIQSVHITAVKPVSWDAQGKQHNK